MSFGAPSGRGERGSCPEYPRSGLLKGEHNDLDGHAAVSARLVYFLDARHGGELGVVGGLVDHDRDGGVKLQIVYPLSDRELRYIRYLQMCIWLSVMVFGGMVVLSYVGD